MSFAAAPPSAASLPAGTIVLGSESSASCRPARVRSKRIFDVVMSTLLIVLTSPIFLVAALMIVLEGGRPVFFRQERVGARPVRTLDGLRWELRTFRIFKFRSMAKGSEHSPLHEEFVAAFIAGRTSGADQFSQKLDDDPRVTRAGHWLRKTSLDELPQLLNVLRGEMSLVGPRPVPLYEAAAYDAAASERLAGRPGLTGAWQVSGRASATFEEMVALDVAYLRSFSLWTDLKLIVLTVPAVLSGRGAR